METTSDTFWTSHIEPLLKEHCAECHNPTRSKSGLDLTSLQAILRGGERGSSVLPGRPEDSNLYKFLLGEADPHMPPGKRKALSAEEVEMIKTWITRIPVAKPTTTHPTNAEPGNTGAVDLSRQIRWRPPARMAASEVIDHYLELAWKRDHVQPAQLAGDATFTRRVYLDLIGRIPTSTELTNFSRLKSSTRREALVDQLLSGPEYARHMREIWDVALMGRRGVKMEKARDEARWFDYLERSFSQNRPWNEVLHDCLTARPSRPEDRGSIWYLYERTNQAQAIAEAVAPIVYGVQVKCAQCHDHMIAREIKQAHYWGLAAAFMRSKNVQTPDGPAIAESAIGGFVSFANLKKESQPAMLTFFNGRRVEETWPKDGEKEQDTPEKYRIPPSGEKGKATKAALPQFSRREAFAETATRDNPLLARATVNRVWAMMFGRGLVHPIDLMDSKHPCSHPELLDWLSEDFANHGHDMRRLFRILSNTKAYQLDSKTPVTPIAKPGARTASKPPAQPDTFSRAITRPLSAEQLFDSMWLVTGGAPTQSTNTVRAGHDKVEMRNAFTRQFPDVFATEYQASLQQAMFLANSPLFDAVTAREPGRLTDRIAQEMELSAKVQMAFRGIFQREPEPDELSECVNYLRTRSADAGARQLVWALLSSAEFQLNH